MELESGDQLMSFAEDEISREELSDNHFNAARSAHPKAAMFRWRRAENHGEAARPCASQFVNKYKCEWAVFNYYY